jgi:hypothetical protein
MKPLSQQLPNLITAPNPSMEGGLERNNPDSKVSSTCLDFARVGNGVALSLVELCADFFVSKRTGDGFKLTPSVKGYCLPDNENQICLTNLGHDVGVGNHSLSLYFRSRSALTTLTETMITVPLLLRYFVEFTPTYEWQRLHEWNTIPNGVETRCVGFL